MSGQANRPSENSTRKCSSSIYYSVLPSLDNFSIAIVITLLFAVADILSAALGPKVLFNVLCQPIDR